MVRTCGTTAEYFSRMAERDTRDGLIKFIWFVLFIWLVYFNQTNQTDQINKRNKPGRARHALRFIPAPGRVRVPADACR